MSLDERGDQAEVEALLEVGEGGGVDALRARERTLPMDPGAPLTPPTPEPAKPPPGKV